MWCQWPAVLLDLESSVEVVIVTVLCSSDMKMSWSLRGERRWRAAVGAAAVFQDSCGGWFCLSDCSAGGLRVQWPAEMATVVLWTGEETPELLVEVRPAHTEEVSADLTLI